MDDIPPEEEIPPAEELIEGIAKIMDKALKPENGVGSVAGTAIMRELIISSITPAGDSHAYGHDFFGRIAPKSQPKSHSF
jgi:hypothetical protein